ncbi:PAC2 [Hepatospora eriocheir]|uniref:PAC2 n=1 Tax=Hepatospora eriocheir TaxID=1081669 RepID=A0A1X0QD53_9MICR|nr:PAC2 [Hepatospora eriocheir]
MIKLHGYISTKEEAVLVFEAVKLGYLTPVTNRFTPKEKDSITHGDILCFVESPKGMKRWTDGKSWSPSKISGEFLLYTEVPRFFSKSAIQKRKRLLGYSCREGEKEISADPCVLNKKCINFIIDGCTYHLINYYRPVLSNNSLLSSPFFRSLYKALQRYKKVFNKEFVLNLPTDSNEREEFLLKNYQILRPENNMFTQLHNIKESEDIAIEGLIKLFNHKN